MPTYIDGKKDKTFIVTVVFMLLLHTGTFVMAVITKLQKS